MSGSVRVSRDEDGIVVATLARPEKKNALTGAMYDTLTEILERAEGDGAPAVIIAGEGGCFCAGSDLADFAAAARGRPGGGPPQRFIRRLARNPVPLIAAVDGLAIGIGTTMTLHCDLVYATPAATFRMPFVDLGLVPEAGSSFLLPRRIGASAAAELLLLAEPYGAERAVQLGLVNGIVAPDGLLPRCLQAARTLAAKPRPALMATRRLLRGDPPSLLAAMDLELQAFEEALGSEEAQARIRAILSRRSG